MMFAMVNDSAYKVLFAAHILAIIAGFGPTLVYTLLTRLATKNPGEGGKALASISPLLNKRVSLPGLAIAVLAGIGLTAQSSGAYSFSQAWISAAFTVIIVMALLAWFVIDPALKRVQTAVATDGVTPDVLRGARASVAISVGLFHIGLIVLVVLMVWKPGA